LHDGANLLKLVREGDSVPGGDGEFSGLGSTSAINASDHVAFLANLQNTSGDDDRGGIWLHRGNQLIEVIRRGDPLPEGSGVYGAALDSVRLNDSDYVSVYANLRSNAGGEDDDTGIYLLSSDSVATLARENDFVPDGNGQFGSFFVSPTINVGGQAAFFTRLRNTNGGDLDDEAIYLSDGIETIEVVRKGDILESGAVLSIPSSINLNGRLNDFGQVLFLANRSGDDGIFLFTPEVHWRNLLGGDWDAGANWTLSLAPAAPHNVWIEATDDLNVAGPSGATAVKSLTIGGGSGFASLNLQPGGSITVENGMAVLSTGILKGKGAVHGNVDNEGVISPGESAGEIIVDGLFSQGNAGKLLIELGSYSNYDRLVVIGEASLDGTLQLRLLNGFAPVRGHSFEILQWGGRSGTFLRVEFPELPAGRSWDASRLYSHGILAVVPEPTGLKLSFTASWCFFAGFRCRRQRVK
jgi:hypothetical protein